MFNKVFGVLIIVVVFVVSGFGQTGSLTGTVKNEADGALVPGVSIEIVQLRRSVESDAVGNYKFESLPPGTYTVITHLEGYANKAKRVTISGEAVVLNFELGLASINAEVTVTATGEEQSVYESFSSVSSVGIARINEKASTSIGEVLDTEAGVSKRSFGGGGSSRPTIRSFEGDRVLILQDGVRNGSIGAGSGDHGEPISPFNLERLEVIKGPATLLYGSNAIGGVINAVSDDEHEAHPGVRGYFTGFGGSVNRQAGAAGGLEVGWKKYLFDLDLNTAREGDVRTPFGQIPNSASQSYGGSTGLGYFGKKGFLRGEVTLDRRRYGIPYAPLFESGYILSVANGGINCSAPEGNGTTCQYNVDAIKEAFANGLPPIPDEQIDIKMRRNNVRLKGGFSDAEGVFKSGNFSVDFTDYRHQEIETFDSVDEVATTFDNDVFSYRGVLSQRKVGRLTGQIGAEGFNRSYLTVGAEQLIDGRVRQKMIGVFTLQQVAFEKVSFQFGARLENNRYNPVNTELQDLDFTGLSAAAGAKFDVWKGGSIVANFATSYRPPALEELYNFGPHIGTVTFEVGSEDLSHERANGVELSVRHQSDKVRVNGSVFYDSLKNFIFLSPQDLDGNGLVDVEDNLPVAFYGQQNARFYGADGSVEVDLVKHFGIYFVGDIVNAKLKDSGTPLPRISPARARFGGNIAYGGFNLRPEVLFAARKGASSIFPLETTTDAYTVVNVNGSYSFAGKGAVHIFTFGIQNLGDELYRTHTNFIKDLAPEAGRGVKASYTVRFY